MTPTAVIQIKPGIGRCDLAFAVHSRHRARRPWTPTSSHPDKDWSDAAWIRFLAGLHTSGTVFLIGGPANVRRTAAFIAATGAEWIINACGLRLIEAAALLRLADLFVAQIQGRSTLPPPAAQMLSACSVRPPVLKYSKFIHAIVPDGGASPGGMTRIEPAHVV